MSNTLILPFIDQSSSFVNGFEAGQIWTALENGEAIQCRACHVQNEKLIHNMCEVFGLTEGYDADYYIESGSDGWVYLTVKKKIFLN